jgi:hypothetical protein
VWWPLQVFTCCPAYSPVCLLYLQIQLILDQKYSERAGCQWITPIILPTQESESRRIVVQSQPG